MGDVLIPKFINTVQNSKKLRFGNSLKAISNSFKYASYPPTSLYIMQAPAQKPDRHESVLVNQRPFQIGWPKPNISQVVIY